MVRLSDRVVLVDVTHPNVDKPFIVSGPTEDDVYAQVASQSRRYERTPDDQNYYKIGAV